MSRSFFLLVLFVVAALPAAAQTNFDVQVPTVVLRDAPFEVTVGGAGLDSAAVARLILQSGLEEFRGAYQDDGTLLFEEVELQTPEPLALVLDGQVVATAPVRTIPGWVSILPPLIAILVALLFKRVVPALFLGIWLGAWVARGFWTPLGWFFGLLDTFESYVLTALADDSHAAIILFSLMIGGMVGIISKNGGTQGVVNHIVRWASDARRGQVATGVLGLAIFFDDYANTLVVGNTMRPVTDRLRISREKLAYIVDSTAAPIACIAFVTTWIGYEVGLIGTSVAQIPGLTESAYSIFLNSILYSFYPLLALFYVFVVANSRRDFGPMYDAEVRARATGQVLSENASVDTAATEDDGELAPKPGKPQRAINAILPVLVLVAGVLVGLYVTGSDAAGPGASLRDIIGEADSYKALMWASLVGMLTAAGLSAAQRILSIEEIVEAWYGGLKAMLFAMIILVLAWALSGITDVLHTADFLVSVLGETLPPGVVPFIVFLLAAATAFATGSSWGTMGILMPLVVPLSWAVLSASGLADAGHYYVLYSTVSCVLGGAVWGDHCSPISDTTILSSMASGCDHIDHVRTQLPYALSVGVVALVLGTLPTGFGFPWWASLLLGAVTLSVTHRYFGRPVEAGVRDWRRRRNQETPSAA